MGTLSIEIDEVTHCLINNETGKEVKTEVYRITRAIDLKGYNTKDWYVNWAKMLKTSEVFALMTEDSEIQGLAAVQDDSEAGIAIFNWAVVAPWNNPMKLNGKPKKYLGVGAHLFAIAVDRSFSYGYDGVILGYPSSKKLLDHYVKNLGAEPFRPFDNHQYAIVLMEEAAKKLREVYDYEKHYG